MDIPNPTIQVPVTSGYLLALYRNWIRIINHLDRDSDYPERLSLNSTVHNWIMLCEVYSEYDSEDFVVKHLHTEFGLNYSQAQWDEVLYPAEENRFGDVCHFISQRSWRLAIRPLQLGPFSSRAAGAFVAIREFLREQGADADQIAPSTPIAPYAARYHGELPFFLLKLSPGNLPKGRVEFNKWDKRWGLIYLLLLLLGIILMPIAVISSSKLTGLIACILWMGAFLAFRLVVGIPKSVEYEGIHTFRDLAVALTHEPFDTYKEIPWTPRRELILKQKVIEQKVHDPQWIANLPRFPESNESDET